MLPHHRRIEEEESATLLDDEVDEVDEDCMRKQIRHALLDKKLRSQAKCVTAGILTPPKNKLPSPQLSPSPPPSRRKSPRRNATKRPRYDDLLNEIEDMRRKIARIEGEQRVERTSAREGELEVLRFDLRLLTRKLSS